MKKLLTEWRKFLAEQVDKTKSNRKGGNATTATADGG